MIQPLRSGEAQSKRLNDFEHTRCSVEGRQRADLLARLATFSSHRSILYRSPSIVTREAGWLA
jgi:hypothetical protein